ncbi:MAG: GMC family oxidoreductase, partial [Cyclobacteriaceae bacterium]|nr:GMC family oxidoreductase [Cyclobacteriaceae bacterium]
MNKDNTYDAIVVGSGISGGWAAKELCEAGLKTLVLERGRDIPHPEGYPTTNMNPWEFKHHGMRTNEDWENCPIQAPVYAYNESTKHFFVNDKEHEYITPEDKPYSWIRGYHVGGRSIMWGRQCYRWSDLDFEANAKDGHGIDWPIRYKDIEPWYDYVEQFVGISGQAEGIPHLPDGKFIKPMEMNCVEKHVKAQIQKNWADRTMTIGRVANLTERVHGRGPCQFRNKCYTGCPYGGYFNSNSATLPAAALTGNMTLRPMSIVHSLIFDEELNKVTGVRVIDTETKEMFEYKAKIIFLCASTIGSTAILLNTKTRNNPGGLGSSSEALGNYLMDHTYRSGARATFEGFDDQI